MNFKKIIDEVYALLRLIIYRDYTELYNRRAFADLTLDELIAGFKLQYEDYPAIFVVPTIEELVGLIEAYPDQNSATGSRFWSLEVRMWSIEEQESDLVAFMEIHYVPGEGYTGKFYDIYVP